MQIIWHAHRGTPALFPENSIPGFLEAVSKGIEAIEMDVVISKDHRVIVSHEPWMNPDICKLENAESPSVFEQKNFSIYQMTTAEIQKIDCGSIPSSKFPKKQLLSIKKPTLQELISECEKCISENKLKPFIYNIEIKSVLEPPNWYQPDNNVFVKLVHEIIKKNGVEDRCILQSFDLAILNAYHEIRKSEKIALLVENKLSPERNLEHLTFIPEFYSPRHDLIDEQLVQFLSGKEIDLIAWTVNSKEEIKRLNALGVQHIVTDYPIALKKEFLNA